MNKTYIHAIGTQVPEYRYSQTEILAWMLATLALPPEMKQKLERLYGQSGIQTRYSVLPDFKPSPEAHLFHAQAPTALSPRMQIYYQASENLALDAIKNCVEQQTRYTLDDITHLIAVSCTGLSAPGLDLQILRALELSPTIQRTCLYYMGCYAAIQALKQADAICRSDPQAVVLVVCVELCTLHFQTHLSLDNLTSSMLFADGAAAVLLSSEVRPKTLGLAGFYSEVALAGWDEMAWNLSETGFLMKLGPQVPIYLEKHISDLVQRALNSQNLTQAEVDYWAIHPGGRKILDLVETQLKLTPLALNFSRQILADYGNMSSPTVLFVLQEIWRHHQSTPAPKQAPVFAAAFGPGLTLESLILLSHA